MELEAKSLRIGNLVTINNPDCFKGLINIPMIVEGATKSKGIENEDSYSIQLKRMTNDEWNPLKHQFIQFIKPIALTEEWLIKTNMSTTKYSFKISIHNEVFSGTILVEYSRLIGKYSIYIGNIHIRYVSYLHELQNWFYSNTGEELTFKL